MTDFLYFLKLLFIFFEWLGFTYIVTFMILNTLLFAVCFGMVVRYKQRRPSLDMLHDNEAQYPPVSILVPAYNEETVIIDSLEQLFRIDYPNYEVVVVSDGSTDNTLGVLNAFYDLEPISTVHPGWVKSAPIVGAWRSKKRPNLTVVDKVNGRKADALNAALNFSKYPIYVCIDADSYVREDALLRCIQPFINDPNMVAVGCGLRVMEGAQITGKTSVKGGIPWKFPGSLIVAFQILEYLRAFTISRIGWTLINAVPLISGAFAMYRKDVVIQAGGYRSGCIGDDSDMTLRVHQYLALINPRKYKMAFIPEPLCWTQVPMDWKSLFNQRIRWQRGAVDGILERPGLLLNFKQPGLGFVCLPFIIVFALFSPVFDVFGLLVLFVGFGFGLVAIKNFLLSLFFIYAYWALMSAAAILLDEITYKTYQNKWDVLKLMGLALFEALGYYHFQLVARLLGLYRHLTNQKRDHGHMVRHAMEFKVVPNAASADAAAPSIAA
jgi:cellulose synthase/poly-beta-1,6-N-acetylglucosamine synthase-like glycosyltransferase